MNTKNLNEILLKLSLLFDIKLEFKIEIENLRGIRLFVRFKSIENVRGPRVYTKCARTTKPNVVTENCRNRIYSKFPYTPSVYGRTRFFF